MRFSVVVGVIGGAVDVAAGGLWILSTMPPASMVGSWIGLALIALGVTVLTTTAVIWSSPVGAHHAAFGTLMIVYGAVMFPFGVAMGSGLLSEMAGAAISGTGMLVIGAGMLYSGATMLRM